MAEWPKPHEEQKSHWSPWKVDSSQENLEKIEAEAGDLATRNIFLNIALHSTGGYE